MFKASGQSIQISAGDTGVIRFDVEGARLTDRDRGVFTVKTRSGETMIRKIIKPEKETEIMLPLVNSDTEKMQPGVYEWDIRVVLNAKFNASGDVVDGDSISTPYAPGQFTVMRVVGNV
jgi:hypothetical protein